MTELEALKWVLARNCIIDVEPETNRISIKVYTGLPKPTYHTIEKPGADMAMLLIECVEVFSKKAISGNNEATVVESPSDAPQS